MNCIQDILILIVTSVQIKGWEMIQYCFYRLEQSAEYYIILYSTLQNIVSINRFTKLEPC